MLVAAAALVLIAALWAVLPLPATSQTREGRLRSQIERSRQRERALEGAVARANRLIAREQRALGVLEQRLVEIRSELDDARVRLARTRDELRASRARLARLRVRLARGRAVLAQQLRAAYVNDRPDVISFVLGADGFADLLERAQFVNRINRQNARVVDSVRQARDETRGETERLKRLESDREANMDAIARRGAAVERIQAAVRDRRDDLVRVRAARAQALAGTRAGRQRAQVALNGILAARARAARAAARRAAQQAAGGGPIPKGGWAIPWEIVECESGGQNLPPNSAGASGYYQMLPDTWKGLGGSTDQAYQASKAEQDRLAAKLWAGGAGASNWVCSSIVGA